MQKKNRLVEFSVKRPGLVIALAAIITIIFATQFPKIQIDTNPKNMLPPTSDVRVRNDNVDKTFALYEDTIVVGVVAEDTVINERTLKKIKNITQEIEKITGVASRDINSFSNVTNVTAEKGSLVVGPLLRDVPTTKDELKTLERDLLGNPLLIGRVVSKDLKTAAIYVPLEKGSNGKLIADKIKEITKAEGGPETYYVAGDPVARDTFGAVMFSLMAVFSPIAGVIMLIAVFLMFRNIAFAATMMGVAMVSIVWSMGLLIALGFPVHIMSSMAPVFLMAIATDGIHIFNEFYFRFRESGDKRSAIIETMAEVSRPVKFTALATAAGFAVLLFMEIIPVKVFGGLIAFGTIALRLLSFSLIPAALTFVNDKSIKKGADTESEGGWTNKLLSSVARLGAERPKAVVIAGIVLVVAAVIGVSLLKVNNNMVGWFKESSEVRVADKAMNTALGGTSLAYIVAQSDEDEYIKTPEAMREIEGLQRHLEEKVPEVGKTGSIVDFVKRINLVLHDNDPKFDVVPDTKDTVGQYIFLFSMSAKPSDLDNVVDYNFKEANIFIQLKTWDASAMKNVIAATEEYAAKHPSKLKFMPAGTAYFNLVWNNEVLWDMLKGFILALIVVFVILIVNFRSVKWAIVGYVPLLFTVLLIYGVVGFIGKDFDMPISVLSCLSLGMAVDFSIHFISRFKQRIAEKGEGGDGIDGIKDALIWTASRPGKGILRNALLFASAFSVMLFAPLTPYITVGAFIVSMMLLSAFFTIIYTTALVVIFRKRLVN